MTELRDTRRQRPGRRRHLLMVPKREKMISRSSSVVTGLSLQTNSTFSGGRTSASGRSPTCRQSRGCERGGPRRHLPAPPAGARRSPSPAGWPGSWPRSGSASPPAPPPASPACRRSPRPLRCGRSAHKQLLYMSAAARRRGGSRTRGGGPHVQLVSGGLGRAVGNRQVRRVVERVFQDDGVVDPAARGHHRPHSSTISPVFNALPDLRAQSRPT